MEIKTISRLAEIMSQHNLTGLEINENGVSIRLERQDSGKTAAPSAEPLKSECAGPQQAGEATEQGAQQSQTTFITAPMPGTFYVSTSPEAAPFVNVGDVVTPSTVVCIVEAMKVMNEVQAEAAGQVVRILVENGAPVEFGQPLFEIAAI